MQVDKENAFQNCPAAGAGGPKASLNKSELQQMLGQCLQLASENKITAQNTWSLPLIENLPELIKGEEGSQTNFQRASVTLDAGVKIYSHRVDSVHTETFKMLGTFGRASGPAGGQEAAEDDGGEGEGVEAGAGPKRRRRVVELNPDATLESTLAALNVKKFDLAFDVDPLFHKTSAQFDEGGAKGLLLNNLSVYRGCEIVFDSMDVPEQAVDCADYQSRAATVDLSSLRGVLEGVGQLGGQARISPTLDEILQLLGQAPGEGAAAAADEFVREVAAAAGEVRPVPSASFMQTSSFSGQAGASISACAQPDPVVEGEGMERAEAEEGYVPHAYDGGAGPGLADSGDYGGEYGDDDGGGDYDVGGGFEDYSDDEGQQSVMQQQQQLGAAPFSTAKKVRRGSLGGDAIQWLISAGASSSSITGKAWAGGSHWRYRTVPQAGAAAEEGQEAEGGKGVKKRSARKKNEPLDFVALLQRPEQPAFEKLPRKAKRPKPAAKTLLPEDHRYKAESLARYALRPRSTIGTTQRDGGEMVTGLGAGSGGLDFGDGDFGGGGGLSDDDDDQGGADMGGWADAADFGGGWDGGSSMLSGARDGTELLSAPRQVEKVEVNYSKAAKQVDVRALKETLWEGLHQVLRPSQHEDAVLSFQDVLSVVPERNPAGRLEDLSVHLCFICVLHLANEHGLVIQDVPELNRLEVSNVPAA